MIQPERVLCGECDEIDYRENRMIDAEGIYVRIEEPRRDFEGGWAG